MVGYEPWIHKAAQRELDSLQEEDQDRLKETIKDVCETEQPTHHAKSKQLERQPGLFRIRVGNVRAICTLSKPYLFILKVGYRSGMYDNIHDLDDRIPSSNLLASPRYTPPHPSA